MLSIPPYSQFHNLLCRRRPSSEMKKFINKLKGDKGDSGSSNTTANSTPTQSQAPSTTQTAIASQPIETHATEDGAKGVLLTTTYGDITIALYTDETPKVGAEIFCFPKIQNRGEIPRHQTNNVTPLDLSQFLHPCHDGQIRQCHLPPHYSRLHDSRRRRKTF